MASLTELLDKPIRVPTGEEVALLQDLVVRPPDDSAVAAPDIYPPVVGLVAKLKAVRGSRQVFIPWDRVAEMTIAGVRLNSPALNLRQFEQRPGELVLRSGLFDRQVVDVEGRRVVRINDLDLAPSEGRYRLVAVDVGPNAMLRRLVGPRLGDRVNQLVRHESSSRPQLIDWAQVAPAADNAYLDALQLRVPRERLALMQPAHLAHIVEQLTPKAGAALLIELDDAHAADALEEMDDEQRGRLLREMDPERAADMLEEMEPDEAADALQNVTSEEAADLLGRMEREDAEDVAVLLGYPEDSAGGIMTTEYVAVPDWPAVGAVIEALRAQEKAASAGTEDPLPDALPELYVVIEDTPPARVPPVRRPAARGRNGATRSRPRPSQAPADEPRAFTLWTEGRLVGVVSLRDLLLADPQTQMMNVMRPVECIARPLDEERDVARLIADEDLVALPVVDDEGKMLGIVTVDDAIDVILPTAWKKRIPRAFH
ncbi:MAG TPA: CBS domain-containing protein [Ktedonobacterales bacterium]|jgi:CBS domain-containing protein/sporulation protein YlmC with PRC-barrel domain|nr:CBS domain-containing protein [Ktedonobacterales bacterium]